MYPRLQRLEHVQPESCSQTISMIPLYIPCLKPLQLCSSSINNSKGRNSIKQALASPQKRAVGKKSLRCSRQLFSSDAVVRATAMEFWLGNMEKVSHMFICSAGLAGCLLSGCASQVKMELYN
jgi:hypothetical protein